MRNSGKSFGFSREQGVNTSKETGALSRDDGCKLTQPLLLLLVVCLFSSAALGQYCSASGGCSDVITGTLNIDSVEVGGIINTGTGCDGYFDYTSMSTMMEIGAGYAITVTNGDPFDASDQCGIWVDWNQDQDFYDAGEAISVSGGPVTFTANISPPGGASSGATRMRIRIRWSGTLDPCGDTDYGEVEDYTINVAPVVPPGYGGGSGEPNDPYLIYTAGQMNAIGANQSDWDKHFRLMANINLGGYTGTSFNIIGTDDVNHFSGVFDGNGHTVSNFTYTTTGEYEIGLFGLVAGPNAEIKDLGLINPNVDAGTGDSVGSLVGLLWEEVRVTNCYVEGGSVSGDWHVGGLVGYNHNQGTISDCYSTGSVSGTTWGVGGLVGMNYGTISHCYSTASVSGSSAAGGLVGGNGRSGSASGGGITINCYAAGSVSGVNKVGGLVGENYKSTVINCYSTGSVSGTTDVGGLVGWNQDTVYSSFWDIQTSGQITSAGGTGKTTAEMKDLNTYLYWGCGLVWTINAGVDYPHLIWENAPGDLIDVQLSDFVTGAGTEAEPYLIYTAEQLNLIGLFFCEWDKHFKLMADIDLSAYMGTSFNIIGIRVIRAYCFTGTFDGNGHRISNFTYSSTGTNNIGLFGGVAGQNAEIKDLGLINPNVDAVTGENVGSLVGWLYRGTIRGCYVEGGSVSGDASVGGLVGWNQGTISDCYSTGSVSGGNYAGGLVGWNQGTISDCYSTGSVGYGYAGGLVGYNYGTITDCYSTSSVSGDYVGGLAGENFYALISNCYAAGPVSSSGSHVGGLVGNSRSGTYNKCFWDNTVNPLLEGVGSMADPVDVIGEPTANLQTESTFTDAGWDFFGESANGTEDIWRLCSAGTNYPKFVWQLLLLGDFDCPDGVDGYDLGVLCGQWLFELISADVAPNGGDGVVNFLDWAIFADGWQTTVDYDGLADFAEQWLKTGASYLIADIAPAPAGDEIVNWLDFAVLAEEWLAGL